MQTAGWSSDYGERRQDAATLSRDFIDLAYVQRTEHHHHISLCAQHKARYHQHIFFGPLSGVW